MNTLSKLLNELCPDGVEYKTIDSISSKISSGGTPKTNNTSYYGGNIPWLRTQEVNFSEISQTSMYITEKGLENSSAKWIPRNCVIVAMYGATVGKVAINKIPLTTNQACCNIKLNEKIASFKYVYYCLSNMYDYIKSLGQGSQTNISAKIVKKIIIPIPPLPVQEEIVRILDNFTELTEELTAELTARKKQYEYYRNLFFNVDFRHFKKLGDLCELKAGATPKTTIKEYWENGTIPWMSSGEVNLKKVYKTEKCITLKGYDNCSTKLVPKESVIIALAGQGKTRGTVAMNMIPLCTNQSLCSLICGKEINPYYLYYFLQTQYENLRYISSGDGNRGGLNLKMLSTYMVPSPPLEEQQRIVDILDRFDKLCNDISEGLPAEIEARQKQYEYYRDKLLTFKPLEEVK